MTDDQLLRAATRIRHLVMGHAKNSGVPMQYILLAFTAEAGDELDAAAVAILREEMAREWMAANHLDDDPTKSFVLTTEG